MKLNQSSFESDCLETLKREFDLIVDENSIYRCQGDLESHH